MQQVATVIWLEIMKYLPLRYSSKLQRISRTWRGQLITPDFVQLHTHFLRKKVQFSFQQNIPDDLEANELRWFGITSCFGKYVNIKRLNKTFTGFLNSSISKFDFKSFGMGVICTNEEGQTATAVGVYGLRVFIPNKWYELPCMNLLGTFSVCILGNNIFWIKETFLYRQAFRQKDTEETPTYQINLPLGMYFIAANEEHILVLVFRKTNLSKVLVYDPNTLRLLSEETQFGPEEEEKDYAFLTFSVTKRLACIAHGTRIRIWDYRSGRPVMDHRETQFLGGQQKSVSCCLLDQGLVHLNRDQKFISFCKFV
jgi:hypothetical protein